MRRMSARPAQVEDAPEVVRLAGLMFTSIGFEIPDWWVQVAREEFVKRLGRDVGTYVVDRPAGGLVASGCAVLSERLPTPRSRTNRVSYIGWVATDPDQRGRGHGTAIIEALVEWSRSQGAAMIELHATTDGEGVYRRLGFSEGPSIGLRRPAG